MKNYIVLVCLTVLAPCFAAESLQNEAFLIARSLIHQGSAGQLMQMVFNNLVKPDDLDAYTGRGSKTEKSCKCSLLYLAAVKARIVTDNAEKDRERLAIFHFLMQNTDPAKTALILAGKEFDFRNSMRLLDKAVRNGRAGDKRFRAFNSDFSGFLV